MTYLNNRIRKKSIIIILTQYFLISLLLFSCNHHPTQTIPANNWTEENKNQLLNEVKQSIEQMPLPEINHNEDEIATRTLNECIIGYPDYNEYKSHPGYNLLSLSKVMQEYIKR